MDNQGLLQLGERLRTANTQDSDERTEILRKELRLASTEEAKLAIYSMLVVELQSQGRFDEAEAAIREQISLAPETPELWIKLALHFFYYTKEIERALSTIDGALEECAVQGHFFRQAHLERIRIALALRAYALVEESLRQLIDYTPKPGALDSQLEMEFLPGIPDGAISASVLQRYKTRAEAEGQRL